MTAWYRDRGTLSFIGKRYLPLLAALNLAWEIAQLPLYTLWRNASPSYTAFAVAHCTVGDVLIGAASLALALTVQRAGPVASWRWGAVAVLATAAGATYTVGSEWVNTLRQAWQYSELMPTLRIGPAAVGLAPLAQWLVLPGLALYLSRLARTSMIRRQSAGISAGKKSAR